MPRQETPTSTRRVNFTSGSINQSLIVEILLQVAIVRVQQPSTANLSQGNDMWIIGPDCALTLNLLCPCVNFTFIRDSHSSSKLRLLSPTSEFRRTLFKFFKQLAADYQPATSFVEPIKELLSCRR